MKDRVMRLRLGIGKPSRAEAMVMVIIHVVHHRLAVETRMIIEIAEPEMALKGQWFSSAGSGFRPPSRC